MTMDWYIRPPKDGNTIAFIKASSKLSATKKFKKYGRTNLEGVEKIQFPYTIKHGNNKTTTFHTPKEMSMYYRKNKLANYTLVYHKELKQGFNYDMF